MKILAFALIALSLFAVNVGKAVHIDDTAHLEIARAILANPWHPMTGQVNWVGITEPIARMNQPHLLFYAMAIVLKVCGSHGDWVLHALWSVIAMGSVFIFYALARLLKVSKPVLLTALFALGPVFLPAINLMVDVPLVGLWIGFFYCIQRAIVDTRRARWLWLGMVTLSAACLVKYTSVILIPLFALISIRRQKPRELLFLLIPLLTLLGWSILNWFDYGSIHLFDRPLPTSGKPILTILGQVFARSLLWLIGVGSVAPFTLVFLPLLFKDKTGRLWILVAGILTIGMGLLGWIGLRQEPLHQSILRGLFLGNSCLLVSLVVRSIGKVRMLNPMAKDDPDPSAPQFILGWWLTGAFLFIVVLTPFMAIRHVLLAFPAILLLVALGPYAQYLERGRAAFALIMTAGLGYGLAVSDVAFADTYRSQAASLAERYCAHHRCIQPGHWGWQWYATKVGMAVYDRHRTKLQSGDHVIIPELVAQEKLNPMDEMRLSLVNQEEISASPWTWLRTVAFEASPFQGAKSGGLYYYWTSIPWTLSSKPLERFTVYLFE